LFAPVIIKMQDKEHLTAQVRSRIVSRMRTHRRARLGRYFSDGARQLWLLLLKGTLTLEDVGRVGSWSRGAAHHWLYGDRRPSIKAALVLEKFFRIPIAAWAKAPRRPFRVPGAALAELGEVASSGEQL
jgi:hypothetical protein